jgi:hypothetical protein
MGNNNGDVHNVNGTQTVYPNNPDDIFNGFPAQDLGNLILLRLLLVYTIINAICTSLVAWWVRWAFMIH